MRAPLALALTLALACVTSHAAADEPTADPEVLFTEGTALMDAERWSDALVKLEAAEKADPGIGTLFNIAVCHEKLGRLATALRTFTEVAQLARASGKSAREAAARARIDALRLRVPAVVFRSDEPSEVLLKVDGALVDKADWPSYALDPGEHVVDAVAAAKKPWSTTLTAPAEGERVAVTIPALAAIEEKTITVTRDASDSRRTLGLIFGGIGAAGVVVAAITGVMVLDAKSTADSHCSGPNHECVDQTGVDAVARGKTLLPLNGIAWGVGGLGLAAGAFFFFTSGSTSPVTPAVGPNAVGASYTRAF